MTVLRRLQLQSRSPLAGLVLVTALLSSSAAFPQQTGAIGAAATSALEDRAPDAAEEAGGNDRENPSEPESGKAASASETNEPDEKTAFIGPIRPEIAPAPAKSPPTTAEICRVIAGNAERVSMDPDFFARLIWKESRFDVGAISPVGARGIAQFMPYTARERGLANPYDYEEAIHHSASYLRDLRNELGNWGLAAAAYNGGINRMKRWIAGGASGVLPYETVDYVNAITHRPVEWFLEPGRDVEKRPLDDTLSFIESCKKLPIMRTRAVFASLDDATPGVPPKPWGVQVAGHERRDIAMRMFARVKNAYASIIGSTEPSVLRRRTGPRRSIYAVRIGADSQSEANALCGRLRQAGGACMVMKN
ncbi:lytic transglycosylase domain-containing protein [Fulvimarina endophytica]|uniref:Lytic transglycosylase domain-containing protein n=1 Tax=Fulvimarina endophytica TaxID=2293836 RepID=A0A371WZQ5_9HYPH|nr:transglycosylase SLT domain-containing protein [Fulvimarina endophytica]RFC62471.1 lytic transglycosylase domain-containing protein [Fulvimarina endophytica]